MSWVYRGNVNLPQADRDTNAWEMYNYFHPRGWTTESIAAMVGNIDVESTVNPQRINANSGASGLTQWTGTRKTNMQNYVVSTLGYRDWTNGDGQQQYIYYEYQHPSATDSWLLRGGYTRSFAEFAANTYGDTLADLTYMWQMCYERVSIGTPVVIRYTKAQYYYALFGGTPPGPGGNVPKWLLFGRRRQRRVKRTIYL